MPTYEYECEACGHKFDHFQSMSSNKLRTCPECKKRKLIRLVGAGAGVIFKGSGFYETDYKRAGARGGDDSSSSSSSGDTSTTSSDGASKDGAAKDSGSGSKDSSAKQSASDSKSDSKTSDSKKSDA